MKKGLIVFVLSLFSALFLLPLLFVLTGSLMGSREFASVYGSNQLRFPPLLPRLASLSQYGQLLLNSPGYLSVYWKSLFLAACICLLQLIVGIPCAYGFATLSFRSRKLLLFLYVIMMMMPFQVTMLPMYQLIQRLGWFDSYWALIVPEIFAPFTVFMLTQFMNQLPHELIESIQLETSSALAVCQYLVIPACKPGIVATIILSFVETWNMVEKPLLYISEIQHYPLSMLLYEAGKRVTPTTLAGCVLYTVPVFLLWICFKDEICQGIARLQIK